MTIRLATPQDTPALAQVFFDAIHAEPSPYTQAQRRAWLARPPDSRAFGDRLSAKTVFVSTAEDRIEGFMTFEPGGYIDLAFILGNCRGRGVFRALCTAIEEVARGASEPRLWTHASLMAQPAFRAMGFEVMHHEMIELAGETLARAQMEKHLP